MTAPVVEDVEKTDQRPPLQRRRRSVWKRRVVAGSVLGAAVVGASVWVGLGSGWFDVRTVTVNVPEPLAGEVSAMASPLNGQSWFTADTRAIAGEVAGIPALTNVEVEKKFPRTVVVTAQAREPVGIVNSSQMAIDSTGMEFVPLEQPDNVPQIDVPQERVAGAALLIGALDQNIRASVENVTWDNNAYRSAITDNRGTVIWGDDAEADVKGQVFTILLTAADETRQERRSTQRPPTWFNVSIPMAPVTAPTPPTYQSAEEIRKAQMEAAAQQAREEQQAAQ